MITKYTIKVTFCLGSFTFEVALEANIAFSSWSSSCPIHCLKQLIKQNCAKDRKELPAFLQDTNPFESQTT
jgi:hypothetical protein